VGRNEEDEKSTAVCVLFFLRGRVGRGGGGVWRLFDPPGWHSGRRLASPGTKCAATGPQCSHTTRLPLGAAWLGKRAFRRSPLESPRPHRGNRPDGACVTTRLKRTKRPITLWARLDMVRGAKRVARRLRHTQKRLPRGPVCFFRRRRARAQNPFRDKTGTPLPARTTTPMEAANNAKARSGSCMARNRPPARRTHAPHSTTRRRKRGAAVLCRRQRVGGMGGCKGQAFVSRGSVDDQRVQWARAHVRLSIRERPGGWRRAEEDRRE